MTIMNSQEMQRQERRSERKERGFCLLFPRGEVEHGVRELDLVADATERLEFGGGLAHGEGLRRVLPRPLELPPNRALQISKRTQQDFR